MPVYSGRGWSGVVVCQLHLVASSVVQTVISRDADPQYDATVVLINTGETRGGAQVDLETVIGLFQSLRAAIRQTRLRSRESFGLRMRLNRRLRINFLVSHVVTPGGEIADMADQLPAQLSLLRSAAPQEAADLLRRENGLQGEQLMPVGVSEALFDASRMLTDPVHRFGMSRSPEKSCSTAKTSRRTRSPTTQRRIMTSRMIKMVPVTTASITAGARTTEVEE